MGKNLDALIADTNKKFKAEIVSSGLTEKEIQKIPFSSTRACYMLYGGVPAVGIAEFFGEPNGGKTTSALDITANAQIMFKEQHDEQIEELEAQLTDEKLKDKQKKNIEAQLKELQDTGHRRVLYVDTEMTLDVEWAKKLGVDIDDLILVQPEAQTAEQVLQIIIDFIETGEIGLVVLDSIPCLVPQQLFEESMEKKAYGGVSGPLSVFSAKIAPIVKKHECLLIGINQEREDLGSMYSTYSTPGGRAWKHACSLRLRFKKGKLLDEDNRELSSRAENPAGNVVEMSIIKTKVCKPDRRVGQYTLSYTFGVDTVYDLIFTMTDFGMITGKGWYSFVDDEGNILLDKDGKERKYQGRNGVANMFEEDEEFYAECWERCNMRLKQL